MSGTHENKTCFRPAGNTEWTSEASALTSGYISSWIKNSSRLASVDKGIETRVEWWETIDKVRKWLATGWKSEKKKPTFFQDVCEMRQEAAGIASTRIEAKPTKRNAVMMGPHSIFFVTEWRCPTVTNTGASAQQVRQGCVWAFHPSG